MAKKSLEEKIQLALDYMEIQNLVNRYAYKLDNGFYDDVVEMFAQKTPGVRVELFPWGVYEGIEGVKRLYPGLHKMMAGDHKTGLRPGILLSAATTTPVIEVAGDGKTAKGLWTCSGPMTLPAKQRQVITDAGTDKGSALQAYWSWAKRAYDFVKEDEEWKIWHYHVYGVFVCPYEKSWVDNEDPMMGLELPPLPDEVKADKPTTYHWIYTPTAVMEYVPATPEPYETWDDSLAYL